MSSRHRLATEAIQRSLFAQYGDGATYDEQDPNESSAVGLDRYLSGNPDISEETRRRLVQEAAAEQGVPLRPDMSHLGRAGSLRILSQRVDEIKAAWKLVQPDWSMDHVCFGVIPGGGLDARTVRVSDYDEYAVLVPDGLFNLLNLFTKLVVLLQPVQGGAYFPTASFAQISLSRHPYIQFRCLDLLRALLLEGDTATALPYARAVPQQDRFIYLLVGAELYVLAHELAHVRLGHLLGDGKLTPESELEADRLALSVLEAWFAENANYPTARASLAALTFLSINEVWERSIGIFVAEATESADVAAWRRDGPGVSTTHPRAFERFQNYAASLTKGAETPGWYIHVHNAIRLVGESLSTDALRELRARSKGIEDISVRALPAELSHRGHGRYLQREVAWAATVAGLLLSERPTDVLLGQWFLASIPPVCEEFYRGLLSDNELEVAKYERAVVILEPMYRSYLPRLRERFRETAAQDQRDGYIAHLAMYLSFKAQSAIGESRADGTPMDPDFFESPPESAS